MPRFARSDYFTSLKKVKHSEFNFPVTEFVGTKPKFVFKEIEKLVEVYLCPP